MLHILLMVMNIEQSVWCTHTHTCACFLWGVLLWRMCTT